jgi:hypothetical protein
MAFGGAGDEAYPHDEHDAASQLLLLEGRRSNPLPDEGAVRQGRGWGI